MPIQTATEIVRAEGYFQKTTPQKMDALRVASDLPPDADVHTLVGIFDTDPAFADVRPSFTLDEIEEGSVLDTPQRQQFKSLGLATEFSSGRLANPTPEEIQAMDIRQVTPTIPFTDFTEWVTRNNDLNTFTGQLGEYMAFSRDPKVAATMRGTIRAAGSLAEGLSTPINLGLITFATITAPFAYLAAIVHAGFSVDLALGTMKQFPEVADKVAKAYESGNNEDLADAVQAGVEMITTGALAVFLGFKSATGGGAAFRGTFDTQVRSRLRDRQKRQFQESGDLPPDPTNVIKVDFTEKATREAKAKDALTDIEFAGEVKDLVREIVDLSKNTELTQREMVSKIFGDRTQHGLDPKRLEEILREIDFREVKDISDLTPEQLDLMDLVFAEESGRFHDAASHESINQDIVEAENRVEALAKQKQKAKQKLKDEKAESALREEALRTGDADLLEHLKEKVGKPLSDQRIEFLDDDLVPGSTVEARYVRRSQGNLQSEGGGGVEELPLDFVEKFSDNVLDFAPDKQGVEPTSKFVSKIAELEEVGFTEPIEIVVGKNGKAAVKNPGDHLTLLAARLLKLKSVPVKITIQESVTAKHSIEFESSKLLGKTKGDAVAPSDTFIEFDPLAERLDVRPVRTAGGESLLGFDPRLLDKIQDLMDDVKRQFTDEGLSLEKGVNDPLDIREALTDEVRVADLNVDQIREISDKLAKKFPDEPAFELEKPTTPFPDEVPRGDIPDLEPEGDLGSPKSATEGADLTLIDGGKDGKVSPTSGNKFKKNNPGYDPDIVAEGPVKVVLSPEARAKLWQKSMEKFELPPDMMATMWEIFLEQEGFWEQRRLKPDGSGISFEEQRKLAKTIVPDIDLPKGTVLNAEQNQALGETVAGLLMAFRDAANRADAALAETGKVSIDLQAELLERKLKVIVGMRSQMGVNSELGRALGNLNALKEARGMPELDSLLRMRQLLEQNGFSEGKVDAMLAKLLEFEPDDLIGQMNYIKDSQKPTFKNWLTWYYMNNLLSNPKTHERNVIGTGASMAMYFPSGWTKVMMDTIMRKNPKDRQIFMGELKHQGSAFMHGFRSGSHKAAYMMKNGFAINQLSIFDKTPVEVGNTPTQRAVLNVVGRGLNAMDQWMQAVMYELEISGQAYAISAKSGLKGAELKAATQDLIRNPSEMMMKSAIETATKAVFRDDPGMLARWIIRAKHDLDVNIPGVPIGDFLVPFARTPANILRMGAESSPLFLGLQFGAKIRSLNPRQLARAQGQAMLGSLSLMPMTALAVDGRLSGRGPVNDPAQMQFLRDQGWCPNCVKLPLPDFIGETMGGNRTSDRRPELGPNWGEYWVSYRLVQPLSLPASFVANMWESHLYNGEQPTSKKILSGIVNGLAGALDQSYLQGVTNLQQFIADPIRNLDSFVAKTLKGFIPLSSAQAGAASAVDSTIRNPQNIVERLQMGISFLSQDLLPRVNVFGEPIERVGSALNRAFTVPAVQPITRDPIRDEFAKIEFYPSVAKGPQVLADEVRNTTAEEQLWISMIRGRQLKAEWGAAIESPEYFGETDKNKQTILKRIQTRISSSLSGRDALARMPADIETEEDILKWHSVLTQESVKIIRPWFTDPKRFLPLQVMMDTDPEAAMKFLADLSEQVVLNTNERTGFVF